MMAEKDLDKITEPRAAAADFEQHKEAKNSVETEKGGKLVLLRQNRKCQLQGVLNLQRL